MRFRLATPDDAVDIVAMMRRSGGFQIDQDLERDWPCLVRGLIERCPTQWIVWEDTTTAPVTPVAYAGSAFVDRGPLDAWLADDRPYLANRLLRAMYDGTLLPLHSDAIRAGNRGAGLTLLVVHLVLAHPSLEHPITRRLLPAGNAAWYFAHGGYNLDSVWFEVFGAEARDFMRAGGYTLWSDYRGSDLADSVPESLRPALFCQRRERVPGAAMHPASLAMFNVEPPVMGLKPSQQRVALHALLGHTDARIAGILDLSAETVRKTWVEVFAAAERTMPALFEDVRVANHRGPEKRRRVLEYLRLHMQELRPW